MDIGGDLLDFQKIVGKQSVTFQDPPFVVGYASVVGKKEGQGPLGSFFDYIEKDPFFGMQTWEEAEGKFQKKAVELALKKAKVKKEMIRYIIGGDLLSQLIATSFGLASFQIPLFGVYGACSTMGEALGLAAMMLDGNYAQHIVAVTSSHFAGAEKQFRFPLDYGNQRPLCATWTVTGSGAVVLGRKKGRYPICITGITTGKVVDYGIKDSMNMGACMAPAAADVIENHLKDFGRKPGDYDKIITGDLGEVGSRILKELLQEKGYDITEQCMDCGKEIFCKEEQDTHAGGSGCGCSAVTLAGYLFEKLHRKEWKRILFVPTGALLSTVSFNEGNTIPGIAHGVVFENK